MAKKKKNKKVIDKGSKKVIDKVIDKVILTEKDKIRIIVLFTLFVFLTTISVILNIVDKNNWPLWGTSLVSWFLLYLEINKAKGE